MTMMMMTEMKIKQSASSCPETGKATKSKINDSGSPVSVAVIITAAGSSSRMGGQKKEYLPFPNDRGTILSVAVEAFIKAFSVDHPDSNHQYKISPPCQLTQVVVTVPPNSGEKGLEQVKQALFASETLKKLWENKRFKHQEQRQEPSLSIVEGGGSRQESVFKALQSLSRQNNQVEPKIVLIHDGARPFVTEEIIQGVTETTIHQGAAACGIPPVDTQKEVDSKGIIIRHLDRNSLIAIQTPQGFLFNPLLEAHQLAAAQNFSATDDTAIWGEYVGAVKITSGSVDNKKITFPGDLDFGDTTPKTSPAENKLQAVPCPVIRTGLGYDLHRLEEGRALLLGGVPIPFHLGEAGHSDGDVLLHAITDALLGAAAISDIGELFPPSDNRWKGADSAALLQAAWELVAKAGWKLANLDCVVAIQEPKILPHREAIRKSIASILDVDISQVFIKAKTGEKLGPVGNSQAVEAWATCLVSRQ